jgi:O-acetylserine/cysteine efflux transporter
MKTNSRNAIMALIVAGALWGSTVALSKLALPWLGAGWLTVARFVVAAPVLAVIGRRRLRQAMSWDVVGSGALGFGLVVILQNAGIQHTSVSHAAVLVGMVPVLVAVVGAMLGDGRPSRRAAAGYALSMAGIVMVARGGGGGATAGGDILVIASAIFSATFIAVQPRVLAGRDAAAVTAVQFASGAALAIVPALLAGPLPHAPQSSTPVIAFIGLAVAGTVLPFWLFAYGQARVSAALAGVFVNLEPVVGAVIGWIAFGDPAGYSQLLGVTVVIGGIAVSALARPPRALQLIARAWQQTVAAQETVLAAARPWATEGPLRWESELDGARLNGSFLPDDGKLVPEAVPGDECLVDS